jgi:hypothetical protein
MPITFPFFLFAKPIENALRWIRLDARPSPIDLGLADRPDPGLAEAQRRIAESLPPHLRRDLIRDE